MTNAHVTIANIKRFELLLRTPLTETQRLTVEMLLGEALEKVGWLQPDPLPAGTTRSELRDAKTIAERNLTEDASLDELREMACHLRALSSESALADVVDTRIAMILAARSREHAARDGKIGSSISTNGVTRTMRLRVCARHEARLVIGVHARSSTTRGAIHVGRAIAFRQGRDAEPRKDTCTL